uniref:Gamma-tubulin complex component 6 n=1 Tax=Electrophorus electricus TaxID=8005 RepID=A0A4W4GN17_ELEEL
MSTWQSGSTSITELLAALCDCSLSGVSWKRHSLGGISRVSVRRVLRRRAYGALLSRLFQDGSARPSSTANALANTPAHNKMLMISFDLRVSGCTEEAERLEKLLAQLHEMTHASGLAELDSVLELLVQLAGSVPPPASSFSRDYMRRVRPVLRRPPPGGYLSQETRRLESRAWALVCGEEWGVFRGAWRTLSLMDAPPGTGLPGLGRRQEGEERFDRDTRLSLFGALQHSRTADMDVRLDLPPLPSNAEVTGLSIRVPQCMDQSEDEGFQSASNLTPDSQSEPSPSPEVDVWEALRTFVPGRRRCWENVAPPNSLLLFLSFPLPSPPGQKESPYLTEAGREAFDQLYRLWEGELRNMLSSQTPSPLLPLPLDSQTQLVKDLLNVLIGVASTTFPLNEASVQFDVRPDVCVSGTSPESVSRLLGELAQYGTHYLRLSRFSLGAADKKGLVFQAFTGGLRRYLHYYRACVLSTPASLSLLTIGFHFRKLGRQLRYLSELCCVNGAVGVSQAIFPVGVKLLSYLYNEAQSNCSNENYPVLLSLLKSSCEPYTRFVSDWVYSGVFRDVYKEFMIQVNEDYLSYRDKHFWVQGYTLISQEAEDCVPVFLRHIANDVYICGKTINLLKICCPQHYIFCSELPVPRIAVIFSLQEMEQIERDCAVYRGRMETIAKHSAVSREEKANFMAQWLSAHCGLSPPAGRQVSQRLAEEVRKRERFEALRQQLELDQEWRGAAKRREQEDDFSFARELRDREQRLQALEQQLERRARMDLIAQYSRLSEEAAKRERRAMWKVQRIRLDEARVGFLQQDQQAIQVRPPAAGHFTSHIAILAPATVAQVGSANEQRDLLQMTAEQDPAELPLTIGHSQHSDVQRKDGHISGVLGVLPSSSGQGHTADGLIRIDELVSEVTTSVHSTGVHSHISGAHIKIGKLVLEVTTPTPSPNAQGHASDAHMKMGALLSDVTTPLPSPGIHDHASDAHIRIGELVSDVTTTVPSPNVHGHASDAHIRIGELVSDVTTTVPSPNIHGHASDAHIRIGELVSDVTTTVPSPNVHGHASDAHIRIGELVSEVTTTVPSPNIHGHASDAHIRIGELVSDVTTTVPSPNVHGHASDAHIRIGELVSEVTTTIPSPNVHGHASDAHIKQVTRRPSMALPMDSLHCATDSTAVQLSEMMPLPVLMKHSVTTPLITHLSLVNKAVVDYYFVELAVEKHFEALRHFLLMEDGEFALSLTDRLFEKLGSGQTPGELLTPLVLNSILNKAMQYSLHGDSELAANFTFALRYLPEVFHPHAPDSLNCLELRYKVDWPLNVIITDSCMNKYNRLFSFLLQLKHMVWSLSDVWFHLKRTALVKGAGCSVQFRQLQLYRHEMQHFVKVIQGYIANQILQVSWSEFTQKLSTASDLDTIHHTHAEYLNRAIFRALLTEKAAPVMNIIHSIFSLILKFRGQLVAQPWESQQGETVHPCFIAMQHYLTRYMVSKLVDKGYQPHLEDFLLRLNFNNYYKDS